MPPQEKQGAGLRQKSMGKGIGRCRNFPHLRVTRAKWGPVVTGGPPAATTRGDLIRLTRRHVVEEAKEREEAGTLRRGRYEHGEAKESACRN